MVNRTVEVDEKAWAKLHINSQNAPTVKDADSGKLTVQQVGKSSEKCDLLANRQHGPRVITLSPV